MPNSLIFAVILAVWAAYLIQHWIRRRDHVATARSVDRFSEAMRVLERRQSLPRADVSPPAPRSYALSLTRPAHPDVVVKRARAGVAVTASTPPRRTPRRLRRPSAAVVRAGLLALGLLAVIAGVTLWAAGQAPWWAAPAGVVGLLLALTLVRVSVGRQRRRAVSPVRSQASLPRSRPDSSRGRGTRHDGARRVQTRPERRTRPRPEPVVAHAEPVTAPVSSPVDAQVGRDVQLYDIAAEEPVHHAQAVDVRPTAQQTEAQVVAQRDTRPAEGTWAPVAVPPPTYTLKAKATRRPASPTPAASEQAGPVLSGTAEIRGLPFDGNAMAFDEEFEELPPVHSVG